MQDESYNWKNEYLNRPKEKGEKSSKSKALKAKMGKSVRAMNADARQKGRDAGKKMSYEALMKAK